MSICDFFLRFVLFYCLPKTLQTHRYRPDAAAAAFLSPFTGRPTRRVSRVLPEYSAATAAAVDLLPGPWSRRTDRGGHVSVANPCRLCRPVRNEGRTETATPTPARWPVGEYGPPTGRANFPWKTNGEGDVFFPRNLYFRSCTRFFSLRHHRYAHTRIRFDSDGVVVVSTSVILTINPSVFTDKQKAHNVHTTIQNSTYYRVFTYTSLHRVTLQTG